MDDIPVDARLGTVFEGIECVVAEFGEVKARACSGRGEEEAEKRRGTVGGGLAAKGRFGHSTDSVAAAVLLCWRIECAGLDTPDARSRD
jgi:hypothetical protein